MNRKINYSYPLIAAIVAYGAYIAYKLYTKKETAKTLNIKLRSIKLKPISQAAVIIEIANPTNQEINLDAVNADILVNSQAISTLSYFKKTVIPANNSIQINLGIQINPLESVKLLGDLFLNKSGLNNITIQGNASADNFTVPFSITQNLSL